MSQPEFRLFGQKFIQEFPDQNKFRRHTDADFLDALKLVPAVARNRHHSRPIPRKRRISKKRIRIALNQKREQKSPSQPLPKSMTELNQSNLQNLNTNDNILLLNTNIEKIAAKQYSRRRGIVQAKTKNNFHNLGLIDEKARLVQSNSKEPFEKTTAERYGQVRNAPLKGTQSNRTTVDEENDHLVTKQSFDNVVAEQYERVENAARKLKIPTGREKIFADASGSDKYTLISPRGNGNEGSMALVRINSNAKKHGLGTTVNLDVLKGPYDDSFYRQMQNDPDGVAAILGKSAKNSVEPRINSVLSKIILNSDWEIMKLK